MHGGIDGISKKIRSTFDRGVSASDLDTRQSIYGVNRYAEKPSRSFWMFVWDALQDMTLIILMVCALISAVVGLASEGFPKGMYCYKIFRMLSSSIYSLFYTLLNRCLLPLLRVVYGLLYSPY